MIQPICLDGPQYNLLKTHINAPNLQTSLYDPEWSNLLFKYPFEKIFRKLEALLALMHMQHLYALWGTKFHIK
jgi:hypothetical protein